MAVAERTRRMAVGPDSNGMLMTPRDFDLAEFDDRRKYELVYGVLIVSPLPLWGEVDPNQELGHLLHQYRDHPRAALNLTLPEQFVRTAESRRRADRVIWAGLGRKPRKNEMPTIVVEFVSRRSRDRRRDYETKREECADIGVKEYCCRRSNCR